MTNKPANRPSLARKVTPKSEAKRTEALDEGIRMTVEGETYEVRLGDITPQVARELRRATGGSFNALREELGSDPDIDSISAFVWLARRIRGEILSLDDVAIGYAVILGDGFDVETTDGPEEVGDSPEA